MASKFSFDNAGADDSTNGSGDNSSGIIDPASLTGTGTGSDGDSGAGDDYIRDDAGNILYTPTGRPRKRRKSRNNTGSGNKAHSADLGKNIDRLSAMLGFAHLAISNGLKVPEFALDKLESDMLASSVVDVMSAFDVQISDKAMAISGLVSACGTIYGPRIISYNIRRKREKEADNNPIIFPSKETQFKGNDSIDPNAFNLGG